MKITMTEDRVVRTIVTTPDKVAEAVERTASADITDCPDLIKCGTRRQIRQFRPDRVVVRIMAGRVGSVHLSGQRVLKSGEVSREREGMRYDADGRALYVFDREITGPAPAWLVEYVEQFR